MLQSLLQQETVVLLYDESVNNNTGAVPWNHVNQTKTI